MIQAFFTELLTRDASGRSWLPQLIAAAPHGERRMGDLLDAPGSLLSTLAVATPDGSLGCFEHPVPPSKELLAWYVDHPDALTWPDDAELSPESERLRHALIFDEPRGARARAQERARELAAIRSPLAQEWWRFEEPTKPGCVLITDRLIIVVEAAGDGTRPVSQWYPPRTELVRGIELGSLLAHDRRWGALVISEQGLDAAGDEALAAALPAAAPHLDADGRAELQAGYLGNLTWLEACDAVGLPLSTLLVG
jgi:hypothetical protein